MVVEQPASKYKYAGEYFIKNLLKDINCSVFLMKDMHVIVSVEYILVKALLYA